MAKKEEKQKTRPDLDDEQYLVYLSNQKENNGIDVYGLYAAMLEWCAKKRITPTRLRLLNWLNADRAAVPMTALPTKAMLKNPDAGTELEPKCKTCNDTREVPTKPKNAKFDWQVEFIPCPDCKKEVHDAA